MSFTLKKKVIHEIEAENLSKKIINKKDEEMEKKERIKKGKRDRKGKLKSMNYHIYLFCKIHSVVVPYLYRICTVFARVIFAPSYFAHPNF
jgi:hypothetical protein